MASRIIETSIAKKAPLTWQQGCFEVISAEKVWRSELAEPIQDGARRIVGASGLHRKSPARRALLQKAAAGTTILRGLRAVHTVYAVTPGRGLILG